MQSKKKSHHTHTHKSELMVITLGALLKVCSKFFLGEGEMCREEKLSVEVGVFCVCVCT